MFNTVTRYLNRINDKVIPVNKKDIKIKSETIIIKPNGSIALNLENKQVKDNMLAQLKKLSHVKVDN